jgi:hypothetical protein
MKITFFLILLTFLLTSSVFFSQEKPELDKLRTESGVDPTRITSRIAFTVIFQDPKGDAGKVASRFSINLGVDRWSFSTKFEAAGIMSGLPGSGFNSGVNDLKFSMLNAFYIKDKHALAASAEFSVPVGKKGISSEYFSVTPALIYSYTINPSLFLAVQPQYTFDLLKDPAYPELSVLSTRVFLAKFLESGYFFVAEPRPIYEFNSEKFDLILAAIIGKSLGGGFNLVVLSEFPTQKETYEKGGPFYQFGFNKAL